ncbi:MAG TPA: NAD-dependent epimerase/dehydratase family protein [Nitriliruptoraceae bacterium]|nr:NAD-dependent epimerase/dehydratase family protein [Nitriliruptoraceae bacterium]
MRILWAGWGDLGTRAAPTLVAGGHEVIALRRSPLEDAPDGVIGVVGDLNAPDGLVLPPDIGACVVTLTPDTRDRGGYESAYLDATTNLHRLLNVEGQATHPQPLRVVFASSTAVYGQDDGSWVSEGGRPTPARFNGEVMVAAESLVLESPTTHGVVARLGGIYGPGRDRLVRSVTSGKPTSTKWTNRIHSDDAAAALAHLATADRPLVPDVVNVVDQEPARKQAVTDFIADMLGVPAPPVDEDDGDAGTRGGRGPAVVGSDHGKRVDGSRLLTTGFRHRHPTFRDGYAALLRER